jgi:hypothetical protein
MLSHIYFLISGFRDVDTSSLSLHFQYEASYFYCVILNSVIDFIQSKTFTIGQRVPVSVKMNYRDGIYAFDSASSSDIADMNVLTWMVSVITIVMSSTHGFMLTYLQGTMLEKFLTVPRDKFSRYLLDAPELTEEEIDTRREAYRYSMVKNPVLYA